MGIVETALRKNMQIGQWVDVTLIGGRELRGRITAFAEDGIMLAERKYERPIAFAGIATCAPTVGIQPEYAEKEELPEDRAPKENVQIEEKKVITQEDGWIERFEKSAGVGSIVCADRQAVFEIADVLDQQLADQLDQWYGREIAVQCTLHKKGALCKATGITGRSAVNKQERTDRRENDAKLPAERYGFGEILHFDKQNGFGKAREGDVKFLFRREDIVSDALWQEIIQSVNTCGIKIAFTALSDGKNVKYTRLREISALQTPENVEKPDFAAVIPVEPEEDVNPYARTTFMDGTVMEEKEQAGFILFYNADKYFGRLQQENGDRYYFRANDVMQKSLLDYLNGRPDVANTAITFSVKYLPTGKTAAGRVKWNAPRPTRKPQAQTPIRVEKESIPVEPRLVGTAEAPVKRVECAALNAYCEQLAHLWQVDRSALVEKMRSAADACDDVQVKCDLLLESVALSDVMREKRDDAMLRYLRQFAGEGGGEQLNGFLSGANYSGAEMFDALTGLFAVSDGACSRLCGIMISDSDMVTLRGEILARFGRVPETAQSLKEMWKPLIEAERARTAYANLLPERETLEKIGVADRKAQWTQVLDAVAAMQRGEESDAAQMAELVRVEKAYIAQHPTRVAVEWMLPLLEQLEKKSGAQGLTMQMLGALNTEGKRAAVVQLTGEAQNVRLHLDDKTLELGEISGCTCAVIPTEEERAHLMLEWDGGKLEQDAEIPMMTIREMDVNQALETLTEQGAAVLCGGRAEQLAEMAEALAQDPDCILIPTQQGEDEEQLLRALLTALEDGFKEKYGAEVAGLMAFPFREKTAQMNTAALEDALLGALRDFGDVRLLHDRLKGAYIALLVDAGAQVDRMLSLAGKVREYGVRTVLTAQASAQNLDEKIVVQVCADSAADKLRAAGIAADEVRIWTE